MKEEWRSVVGYEGIYDVSSYGNVRRSDLKKKRMLKQTKPETTSYAYVCLCHKGKIKNKLVHRLVAEAFLGKIPSNMVVNHIDHNKRNNNLKNLEICTQKQNIFSAIRNGSFTIGEKNGCSKLKDKDIIAIRVLCEKGVNQALIAKIFNVAQTNISEIKNKKTWKHID